MPRHATGLHAVQTGHQSVAPPRSATASRCAPSQGSRLLGIAPAPAAAPWFRPPESVGNHVNILSTTVVLEPTPVSVVFLNLLGEDSFAATAPARHLLPGAWAVLGQCR